MSSHKDIRRKRFWEGWPGRMISKGQRSSLPLTLQPMSLVLTLWLTGGGRLHKQQGNFAGEIAARPVCPCGCLQGIYGPVKGVTSSASLSRPSVDHWIRSVKRKPLSSSTRQSETITTFLISAAALAARQIARVALACSRGTRTTADPSIE